MLGVPNKLSTGVLHNYMCLCYLCHISVFVQRRVGLSKKKKCRHIGGPYFEKVRGGPCHLTRAYGWWADCYYVSNDIEICNVQSAWWSTLGATSLMRDIICILQPLLIQQALISVKITSFTLVSLQAMRKLQAGSFNTELYTVINFAQSLCVCDTVDLQTHAAFPQVCRNHRAKHTSSMEARKKKRKYVKIHDLEHPSR